MIHFVRDCNASDLIALI
ncbi:Hypothetical protein LEPBI_I0799 [Leptospira biflexa serovar Patoc strain 'Patoc 1 (Paris)']|uniref:Uncharacterized protein n=1 Tax=Leptospira biflexa serovar Patoc (strain Patoc 1 / ATCC 23582 / Paris) TaxID=456481 RepID=B0SLC0_LEPBP|nr:Hypothetical protein LEPBI_I0799 [Leptospira biflexa serovar Patoc strain 'Patoc 1 (Paris)']